MAGHLDLLLGLEIHAKIVTKTQCGKARGRGGKWKVKRVLFLNSGDSFSNPAAACYGHKEAEL